MEAHSLAASLGKTRLLAISYRRFYENRMNNGYTFRLTFLLLPPSTLYPSLGAPTNGCKVAVCGECIYARNVCGWGWYNVRRTRVNSISAPPQLGLCVCVCVCVCVALGMCGIFACLYSTLKGQGGKGCVKVYTTSTPLCLSE